MTSLASKNLHRPVTEGSPGSVVWFISFGDLLTLLLCFFLVLTPWDRLNSANKTQSLQRVSAQGASNNSVGTTFASDPSLRRSVMLLELPILERDWLAGADGAENGAVGALAQELQNLKLKEGRISLLICAPRVDRARVVKQFRGLANRIMGSAVVVEIRLSGSCDGSAVLSPVTENVIGRIRVTGT